MSSREAEAARIFLEAVEHHERGQWAAFAWEAAAGDPLVLQRVDALLKAHGEPNPLLDGDRLVPTEDAPPTERGARHGHRPVQAVGANRRGWVRRRLHGRADAARP